MPSLLAESCPVPRATTDAKPTRVKIGRAAVQEKSTDVVGP